MDDEDKGNVAYENDEKDMDDEAEDHEDKDNQVHGDVKDKDCYNMRMINILIMSLRMLKITTVRL